METTASRQQSYADPKCRDVESQVGDYVFPKVSPMKGVMRFGKKGKYISNPSRVLQPHGMEVSEDLTCEGEPIAIVDYQVRQLRLKTVPMVQVLQRNNNVIDHS